MAESYPALIELISRLEGKDKKTCELALYCLNKLDKRVSKLWVGNERLRAALKECAQDLEAEINARYQIDGKVHPAEQRKYDRDMSTVRAAVAALKETGNE